MMMAPDWAWMVFGGLLISLLVVDLWVHRRHSDSRRAAMLWSIIWVAVGLAFAGFVGYVLGTRSAHEYLAAYLIEKSLSLDNLFVFLLIFTALNIPKHHHHRALSWGIFGALVFRGLFIVIGAEALNRWHWLDFVFGGLLLYAAIHAWRVDPRSAKENRIVKWLSQRLPVSRDTRTPKFVLREGARRVVTPLLVAILAIEITDIIFATDSVPAALSVSRREFVVYSSNAFAVLGLRALYVVLADFIRKLVFLNYGLATVLGFAALKIGSARWVDIPPLASVAVIAAILALTIWLSVRARSQRNDVRSSRESCRAPR